MDWNWFTPSHVSFNKLIHHKYQVSKPHLQPTIQFRHAAKMLIMVAKFVFGCRRHYGARWVPDAEWLKQWEQPVLFNEAHKKWGFVVPSNKPTQDDKQIKNMMLNFGPQHP